MTISSYSDLLKEATSQTQPQRMLFTFARAELPDDAGAEQQARFAARQGGTLTPVMCVDKPARELRNFTQLVEESQQTGQQWDIVFVSSMSGHNGVMPPASEAEAPLKKMVAAIRDGQIGNFLAFDRAGELVSFS